MSECTTCPFFSHHACPDPDLHCFRRETLDLLDRILSIRQSLGPGAAQRALHDARVSLGRRVLAEASASALKSDSTRH